MTAFLTNIFDNSLYEFDTELLQLFGFEIDMKEDKGTSISRLHRSTIKFIIKLIVPLYS